MKLLFAFRNRLYTTDVDLEDYLKLNKYNWHGNQKPDGKLYVRRTVGKGKSIQLHREIMNAQNGTQVDHKDGDTLNNRRNNLRLATNSQNQANSPSIGGRSEYKGVAWHTESNKWVARIGTTDFFGKKIREYLGLFDNEEEAGRAYDKRALELWGEFAFLNFPNEESAMSHLLKWEHDHA